MITYDDKTPMPFGMHHGTALANVPASYLLWCLDNIERLNPSLKKYIEDNKDVLTAEAKRQYKFMRK